MLALNDKKPQGGGDFVSPFSKFRRRILSLTRNFRCLTFPGVKDAFKKVPNIGPIKGIVWLTALVILVLLIIIIVPIAVIFSGCPRPSSVSTGTSRALCSGPGGTIFISGENFNPSTFVYIESPDGSDTYDAEVG